MYYVPTLFMPCQFVLKYIPISKPHIYNYIIIIMNTRSFFLFKKGCEVSFTSYTWIILQWWFKLLKAEDSSLVLSVVEMLCSIY